MTDIPAALRDTVRRGLREVEDPAMRAALEAVAGGVAEACGRLLADAHRERDTAQAEVERLRAALHHPHRERVTLN